MPDDNVLHLPGGAVPILGHDVQVKREHLEFFKTVLASAYAHLHYADISEAAAHFAQPQPRALTNALEAVGQAILDYLDGNEVVLPHERSTDAPDQ